MGAPHMTSVRFGIVPGYGETLHTARGYSVATRSHRELTPAARTTTR
jgi:hypothetical protein